LRPFPAIANDQADMQRYIVNEIEQEFYVGTWMA